jgi:hypothetical protein
MENEEYVTLGQLRSTVIKPGEDNANELLKLALHYLAMALNVNDSWTPIEDNIPIRKDRMASAMQKISIEPSRIRIFDPKKADAYSRRDKAAKEIIMTVLFPCL